MLFAGSKRIKVVTTKYNNKQPLFAEAPDRSGWSLPPSRTSTPAARYSRQHHTSHVRHCHTCPPLIRRLRHYRTSPPLSHVRYYQMSPPLSDVSSIITCLHHYHLLINFLSGDSRHLPTLLPSSPFFPAPATSRHRGVAFVLNFYKFVLVVFVTIGIVIIIFTIVIVITIFITIIIVIITISAGRRPRNSQTKMPSPTPAPILTRYTTLCPHYIISSKPTTYLSSTI